MRMNIISKGLLLFIMSQSAAAFPTPEFIAACKNDAAWSDKFKITEDELGGFEDYTTDQCDEPYSTKIDGISATYTSCKNENGFIINGQKIPMSAIEDYSVNPNFLAGELLVPTASWIKIDDGSLAYLCVKSALSNSGKGGSHTQYYMFENVFNGGQIKGYYFYFDKPEND